MPPGTENALNGFDPAIGFVTPLGLAFTLAMGLLLICLPRKYALVPVIVLTCYMTMGQVVMIAGLHFTMIRILTLFGWVRVMLRGEMKLPTLNPVDKALIGWTLASVVSHTVLWQTSAEFVNRLGLAYNAIGLYFLFRFLVRDAREIERVFKITAVCILPLAAAMLLEKLSGRNIFAVLGGVFEFTIERDGVLRCQGPFSHPILAGTFGACLLPFFLVLWHKSSTRLLATAAIIGSTIIVIAAGSSGPIMTYMAGLLGVGMWRFRKYMRTVRWGLLLGLIVLQLCMKAPIWFLIGRVYVFSGSTGFHRAMLIDQAVLHFSDWWLLGMKNPADVFDQTLHGDFTNEYVWQAVTGGLAAVLLFMTIIACCFMAVGRFVARRSGVPVSVRLIVWSLGAALFAHALSYLSIQYFDQNFVSWYLLLAMIAATMCRFESKPTPQTATHDSIRQVELSVSRPVA